MNLEGKDCIVRRRDDAIKATRRLLHLSRELNSPGIEYSLINLIDALLLPKEDAAGLHNRLLEIVDEFIEKDRG